MGHEDAASGREEGITVLDYRWHTILIAHAACVLGILTSPFLCLHQMQLLAANYRKHISLLSMEICEVLWP